MRALSLYQHFFKATRPFLLIGGMFTYSLGAGIARYLGNEINWTAYWLVQACFTLMQLSSYYLNSYFDQIETQTRLEKGETPVEKNRRKQFFFQLSAATLSIGALITVLLFTNHLINPAAFILFGIAFLFSMMYALPPMRLGNSGYGEFISAIMLANIAPALSFLFQVGEIHRLLAFITFPLTFLAIATFIVLALPKFSSDIWQDRSTLLVRLGWQRGMAFHHYFIGLTYILFVIASFSGLPWRLAWPPLLTLPIAIFQVWQLNQISAGTKPRWRLLVFTALATFGLMVYFLSLALWTD